MKVRPLNDQIIVERMESEEKTSGGIIIPDTGRKSREKERLSPWGAGN